MADYIVKDTELTSVANAIRTAGGTSSLLNFPNGFISAVNNISGGGSSDLSTAEVTITIAEGKAVLPIPVTVERGGMAALVCETLSSGTPTTTVNIPLYKGMTVIRFNSLSGNVTTTGDCEYADYKLVITGDCTITIS